MTNKEILTELLKKHLDNNLKRLEKKSTEEETNLKQIKKQYDGFLKNLKDLVKRVEEKQEKDRLEKEKKKLNPKTTKKEINHRNNRKDNISNFNQNSTRKRSEKHTTSTRGKSINKTLKKEKTYTKLNTEPTSTSRNTNKNNNINRRKSFVNKKNEKEKSTIENNNPKKLRQSKSMGKLPTKNTLKKIDTNADKVKKELEEMQKMVNNISIKNVEKNENETNENNTTEKENPTPRLSEPIKKIELPPPTLMGIHKINVLEKYISPYLKNQEQINLYFCNKTLAPLALGLLKDKLANYKTLCDVFIGQTIDDKINNLSVKFPQEEIDAPIKEFQLSKGSTKALCLLDSDVYLRIFKHPVADKILDEIIIIYKLFCQLLLKEDLVIIEDKKIFWEKLSKYIMDNKGDKLSDYCLKCAKQFQFDDKNIMKLRAIAKEKSDKIKPGYFSKICGTTGLFAYLVKDALEYCGAIEDKKTPGNRVKANLLYEKTLLEHLERFISYLTKINVTTESEEKKEETA